MKQDDIWGKPADEVTVRRSLDHSLAARKLARRAYLLATLAAACAVVALAVAIWR